MNAERWRVSLHEAGHAACALAQGGRCHGAGLNPNGGGSALLGLSDVKAIELAYAFAGGPQAEKLAERYPAPPMPAVPEIEPTTTAVDVEPSNPGPVPEQPHSDDRIIALWAITGAEANSGSWHSRVLHVHKMAAEIIRRNEAAVIRIATALHARGHLKSEEITHLFEGSEAC